MDCLDWCDHEIVDVIIFIFRQILLAKRKKRNWLVIPFKLPWNKTKWTEKFKAMVFVFGWFESFHLTQKLHSTVNL